MTPTNTDFEPLKKDEYRLYQIWKALPLSLKTSTGPQIENQKLKYQNQDIHKLIGIRTQKHFGETFNIHEDTLTDWNQNPVPDQYQVDWRIWVREHTKEIWDAFIKQAIEKGDPQSLKTYMQIAEDYEEKSTIAIDGIGELFDTIKQIAERSE